ncbi:unnamed protein product [Echinostoma caproni]|uniref:Protein kinase domain-containing protein n=1 Tax=Echinostoma caproni TaxID=27848 RepID=A0A183AXC8_9TREM|nr:unnamed protein product [Echinostoma caproni]
MARPDPRFAAPECLSLTATWTAPFVSRKGRPAPEGQDVILFHEGSGAYEQAAPSKSRLGEAGSRASATFTSSDQPGPWSDMFSLGLIICVVYKAGEPAQTSYERQYAPRARVQNTITDDMESNVGAPTDVSPEFSAEATRVERLRNDSSIPEAFRTAVTRMPMELVEPVEKMLSRSSQKRPSSQLFSLLKFFNDPSMLCLDVLLSFEDKSQEDRIRALQNIHLNVDRFPKDLLLHRFLPMLLDLLDKYHRRLTLRTSQTGHYIHTESTRRRSISQQDVVSISGQTESDMEVIRKLVLAVACIVQKSSPADYNDYVEHYAIDFIRRCKHVEVS